MPKHGLRAWAALSLLLIVAGVAGLACSQSSNGAPPSTTQVARRTVARQNNQSLAWQGISSCSAQACHGDIAVDQLYGIWGNEYTLWAENDPHAKAHRVLYEPRSVRMAQLLHDRLDGKPAHEARLCLDCHAPQAANATHGLEQDLLSDGVGCENCHANGQSSAWIAEHVTSRWQSLTPADKQRLGFADTKDLYYRANRCAECHVGSGDRDVDHDLIAAGHPRLSFELSTFMATLPKHWDEKAQRDANPAHEARTWAIGQAVTARAAAELLAARAESTDRPWPEFSEYSCFACHHELRNSAWRRQRAGESEMAAVTWGSWYMSGARALAQHAGAALGEPGPIDQIQALSDAMSGDVYGSRDRKRVIDAARSLAEALDDWARRLKTADTYNEESVRELLARVAADDNVPVHWDGATQTYLAMVALHQAYHDQEAGASPLDRLLDRMYEGLRFKTPYDSPADYRPEQFLEVLDAIRDRYPPAEVLRK